MTDFSMEIRIPSDDDGFVLLKCPQCGEYFKLAPSDIESDEVLDIHCPLCGLVSDSYLTEDVIELAQAKAMNYAMNMVYDAFRDIEKKTRNSFIKFEVEEPDEEPETPIRSTIDSMRIVDYFCCGKQAKIRPLLSYTISYCPFCGGVVDGFV